MFENKTIRQVRKFIIALVGFTVLAVGLAMIVLPGPAIIVIPAGLGILGLEFSWASRLLKQMRTKFHKKNARETDSFRK